jgi:hypothetical protein
MEDKILDRKLRRKNYLEETKKEYKRGDFDGRDCDLSYYNYSHDTQRTDPENPSKILYDKFDLSGSLLHVIFRDPRMILVNFISGGRLIHGVSSPAFTNANEGQTSQVGVSERVHDDKFFITTLKPSSEIIAELEERGIRVSSGGEPLKTVLHEGSNLRFTHIYANRRDAIGSFTERDLPTS